MHAGNECQWSQAESDYEAAEAALVRTHKVSAFGVSCLYRPICGLREEVAGYHGAFQVTSWF